MRQALGVGRGRLVTQLVFESVLLTLTAAGTGLLLTWWSLDALLTLVPDGLPRIESVRIDPTVVLFTAAVALATSMLAGVAPAVWWVRIDLVSALRNGGRGSVCGRPARPPGTRRRSSGARRLYRCGRRAGDPERASPAERLLDGPLARPRFNAFLLGVFGLSALVLAAVGLAAVMAVYVRQRDREIALRVALGATPANVRRLVLREALTLAGLGAAVGLAGATAAMRFVRGMLFEVAALDPLTLGGAALLLIAVAALAASGPARRATRLDAIAVLRD